MNFNFRENLRNELDYQGILVKELSARTGIPVASLDCYLSARATVPSVEAAVKIARALRVSVEHLAIGENQAAEKTLARFGREAREIITFIERLSPEQCRAILTLIKSLKNSIMWAHSGTED